MFYYRRQSDVLLKGSSQPVAMSRVSRILFCSVYTRPLIVFSLQVSRALYDLCQSPSGSMMFSYEGRYLAGRIEVVHRLLP